MSQKMLAGRCALVTGSIAGLGHAIADSLAAQGAHIVLHGLEDIEQALAARDSAMLDLERTTVRAPVSGVVSESELEAGEHVEDGQPVFSIVEDERILKPNERVPDLGDGRRTLDQTERTERGDQMFLTMLDQIDIELDNFGASLDREHKHTNNVHLCGLLFLLLPKSWFKCCVGKTHP